MTGVTGSYSGTAWAARRGPAARGPVPGLTAARLVEPRLGMAQLTAFTASLDPPVRRRLVAEAVGELGGHPPLVRRVVFTAIR